MHWATLQVSHHTDARVRWCYCPLSAHTTGCIWPQPKGSRKVNQGSIKHRSSSPHTYKSAHRAVAVGALMGLWSRTSLWSHPPFGTVWSPYRGQLSLSSLWPRLTKGQFPLQGPGAPLGVRLIPSPLGVPLIPSPLSHSPLVARMAGLNVWAHGVV